MAGCPGSWPFGANASGRKSCLSCVDGCKSYFPNDQGLINACKNACYSGDYDLTRESFLQSIGQGTQDQQEYNELVSQNERAKTKTILTITFVTALIILAMVLIKAVVK